MKNEKPKLSIVGAGNVGATLAMRVAERGLADVLMVDLRADMARAKALDLSDAASLAGHESKIYGTGDFRDLKDSSIVAVTAGFPRMPGMSREELLFKNKRVIEEVMLCVKNYAPGSIVIIVTNPLDIMTYIAYKVSGFPRNRVMGMAGDLDSSRFIELIAEKTNSRRSLIRTVVMGSHGDTMVPVASHTRIAGNPIDRVISDDELNGLIEATKKRGAQIVSLLGQGSAYYAPSAAACSLAEAVIADKKESHCVSAFLEGEYGLKDICIGVPATIGGNGIEHIIEIRLSEAERESFGYSAEKIKGNLGLIKI